MKIAGYIVTVTKGPRKGTKYFVEPDTAEYDNAILFNYEMQKVYSDA